MWLSKNLGLSIYKAYVSPTCPAATHTKQIQDRDSGPEIDTASYRARAQAKMEGETQKLGRLTGLMVGSSSARSLEVSA